MLLIKGITLLYKESLLPDDTYNSKSLVNTLIENIVTPGVNIGVNTEFEVIKELKEICREMVLDDSQTVYDPSILLQRINLIPYVDEKIYKALEEGFKDSEESNIKRSISILKKNINNYFREKQIEEVLQKQFISFKHHREKIKDINVFIRETIDLLEPLEALTTMKDPAVINEIDIGNENSTIEVFNEIKENKNGNRILKTGWKALNRMLQGGFRAGEFVCISALPHMYKTGFTLTLFKQIALYNTPDTQSGKKPLLLRISFEDEMRNNLDFLYQNLKFNETLDPNIPIPELSSIEMSTYIKNSLEINGFSVKMMRVDPSQWTYRNICNKVLELEANGFEIKVLVLDYLSMIPTTGCNTSGATGTDIRDLFRRIRNFCSAKGITVITPHQLSTEAKNLARSGIARENFVKEIAEKGYYSGSKQLDQEMDIDLYIDLVKHNKDVYLAVQRGKHRIPTIVDEKDKYFLLKFPPKLPIPDDINQDVDISFRKPGQTEDVDELFTI